MIATEVSFVILVSFIVLTIAFLSVIFAYRRKKYKEENASEKETRRSEK